MLMDLCDEVFGAFEAMIFQRGGVNECKFGSEPHCGLGLAVFLLEGKAIFEASKPPEFLA